MQFQRFDSWFNLNFLFVFFPSYFGRDNLTAQKFKAKKSSSHSSFLFS